MRPIDADALMDNIKRDSKKAIDEGDKVGSFWLGYAAGSVIAQPTIQPETDEGKWEQVSAQRYFTSASYFYRCSVCGENNPRNTKYCPNCGARMKGEI